MKKFSKTIYYVFWAGIIAIAILFIVSVFPITGNFRTLIVQSGSMEPAIKQGSVVIVMPAADYKAGDVITFYDPDTPKVTITHRIFETKNENGDVYYITKGDANNAPDREETRKEEVLGRVLFSIPYLGYVIAVAKKPYGFAALIILPSIIIIMDEIKKIRVEIKKKKNEKEAPV